MFVSIHALISYPPSNPNRDDLNRPKTAVFGGAIRQRMSSQSLKRAWRTSPLSPMQALDAKLTTRTRRVGVEARDKLLASGVAEKLATESASAIAGVFGKISKKGLTTEEVVVLGPEEQAAIDELLATIAREPRKPTEEELEKLELPTLALDTALWGRMRADKRSVNVDAACQVAHAITTSAIKVESDYWTAVDDINEAEDSGAGGIGEREFASGVFYLYLCVDVRKLIENLSGNAALAADVTAALAECVATIGPGGHQTSYANRTKAGYLLAEAGGGQPFTYADAFEHPVTGRDISLTEASINRIEDHRARVSSVYAREVDSASFNLPAGEGTLADVKSFVHRAVLESATAHA